VAVRNASGKVNASVSVPAAAPQPVEILPYQERWPAEFAHIADTLRAALGGLAARVDHIGSTSVPGLASKDRIDIQIGVRSLDERDALVAAMTPLGYTPLAGLGSDHVPAGEEASPGEWSKLFFTPAAGQRAQNVHVREIGRRNWRYALLFRDYLRAQPAAAAGYAELKRRLAALPGVSSGVYADTKDPVCDIIMAAAEDWAMRTGWTA
jgi:GrpB-like predicted nucleotidyltransferase (UPF0157 family)